MLFIFGQSKKSRVIMNSTDKQLHVIGESMIRDGEKLDWLAYQ